VQRPRPASHAHFGHRQPCRLNSSIDLKEASEEADRRSGSREFHTEVAAVEKARDAKYEATGGFENKGADDDRSCLAG